MALLAAALGAAAGAHPAGVGGAAELFEHGAVQPPDLYRLHIIPHSDEPSHQQAKLAVRDAVMAYIGAGGPGAGTDADTDAGGWSTPEEAARWMESHRIPLEKTAAGALARYGAAAGEPDEFLYEVRIETGLREFPAGETLGVAVPAGVYPATVIVLGDGAGQNWWCVLFPSICFYGAAGFLPEDGDFPAVPVITPGPGTGGGGGGGDATGVNGAPPSAPAAGPHGQQAPPAVSRPEVRWAWKELLDGPRRGYEGGYYGAAGPRAPVQPGFPRGPESRPAGAGSSVGSAGHFPGSQADSLPGGAGSTPPPPPSLRPPSSPPPPPTPQPSSPPPALSWWRLWLATAGYPAAGADFPGAQLE